MRLSALTVQLRREIPSRDVSWRAKRIFLSPSKVSKRWFSPQEFNSSDVFAAVAVPKAPCYRYHFGFVGEDSSIKDHIKLFDLSTSVLIYRGFLCLATRADNAAHMNAIPVPDTYTKKAQLSLQWPSL